METGMEGNMDILSPQEQSVSEAKSHIERNLIQATNGRECVDGRYDQHSQESGFLARPGADFGYVMGLLALIKEAKINLTPQEAVDKVYAAVTKDGGRFYAHTDHHTTESHGLSGCGHIAKSTLPENSEKYGVNGSDVVTAINYMREITAHRNVEEAELQGEHEEKGVLIVRGKDKTVDHHDDKSMYFVYDADRDADFQKYLVDEMGIDNLTLEDFSRALETQTNATVSILAAGKPILEVDTTKEIPEVKFVAMVPRVQ